MNKEDEKSIQINVAENQRNAGRDYFEINHAGNIAYFLATEPEQELDNVASSNETMFKYRFGITVNHCVRSKIIRLKSEHFMTDVQTSTLIKSGQIRHQGQAVLIAPDRISPLIGSIFIALLSIPVVLGLLHISLMASKTSISTLLYISITLGFWFCAAYLIKKYMIAPWKTLKDSGILNRLPDIGYMDSFLVRKYPINISE